MKNIIFGVVILSLTVLTAVLIAATGEPALAQNSRMSIHELAEELGLTFEQAMELRKVLEKFQEKRAALEKEAGEGTAEAEVEERKRWIQRDFFEALSKILTSEQIMKYKRILREKPGAGQVAGPAEENGFPWFVILKRAISMVEMSGLQKQAVDEMFGELEAQAGQMRIIDPGYDPSRDISVESLIFTKLEWIFTKKQYQEFNVLLESERKKSREEKPAVGGPSGPGTE